MAAVVLENRK